MGGSVGKIFQEMPGLSVLAAPLLGGAGAGAESGLSAELAAGAPVAEGSGAGGTLFGPGSAEALDASLIGPASGAAAGSGSMFAPGAAGLQALQGGTGLWGGNTVDPLLGRVPFGAPGDLSPATMKPVNASQISARGAPGSGAGAPGAGGPPPATIPPGADKGGTSFVDTLIKQMKDNALGLGLVGASAMMSAGQQKPMPNQQQIQQLGTQAQGVAQQLISQYQSGALQPGQQASLDQLTQNTKNQLKQYFASIGQGDSTAAAQALAQVDQTALGMKQQMLDSALQQGLSAIGVAQGPLNSVAQYQLGQDQALRQAFGNFASSIGTLFGRQSGTPQQPQTSATAAPTISSAQPAAAPQGESG